jgi:hypothetical protein
MTSPPLLVVVISGSVPRRPTRVRRASWDGRVVVNARVKAEDIERGVRAALRSGESRKDILGGWSGWLVRRMLEVPGSTSKYRTGENTGRNSYCWLSGKTVEERVEEGNYFWVGLEVGFAFVSTVRAVQRRGSAARLGALG